MSNVDLLILAFIGLSAAMSFFRGVAHEALSLMVWVAAMLISLNYSANFATLLPIDSVQSALARATISGVVLFMGTLFLGGIIRVFVAHIFNNSKLRIFDRLLGVAFGALRGVIIFSLLVLAANLSPELKRESWWQSSSLIPSLQVMAGFIHAQLPDSVGQHFDIHQTSL
ncbi:MAG: CvpA family protein [Granulosicoccus sp.]